MKDEQLDHNIDVDLFADHASVEHQELSRRVAVAFDEYRAQDSDFCRHCAGLAVVIAKVVQFQYLMEIGTDHEKDELRPFLELALRERLAIGRHNQSAARS